MNEYERFKYLNLLVGKYPEDKSLKSEWCFCGMNTGHEEEVASFWIEMKPRKMRKNHKFSKKLYFVSLNGKQIIEFMEQQREVQKEKNQAFLDCEIPIHALINNNTLAELIYNWWDERERFYGHYIHYSGRQFDIPDDYEPKSIIMDYSAFLCAYCLGIFPKLENYFTKILVSPIIFHLIDIEISKLNISQKNCYDSNKKLYAFLKRNTTQITIITGIDKIEEIDNVWAGDTYVHKCAVSVNAYVVDSSSGTELFYEKRLPSEYEKTRISENEVVDFLNNNGIKMNLSDKNRNVRKQQGLKIGDNILVNRVFLEELQKQIDLSDVSSLLNLHITEREYLSIEVSINDVDNIRNCIEWLKGLKFQMTSLLDKGFLSFHAPCTDNKSLLNMQENKLFESLAFTKNKIKENLSMEDLNKANETLNRIHRPKVFTFKTQLDEFLFLGFEQAVTNETNFGTVWDNYFKTSEKAGFGNYEQIIWYYKNGEQIYFVGKIVKNAEEVPEGFSLVKFPACEYMVVTHEWTSDVHDGIGLTQEYIGIGQTHDYKDNIPMLDGYVRYDGMDSPITQIEVENANTKDGSRFERWVPIKKVK